MSLLVVAFWSSRGVFLENLDLVRFCIVEMILTGHWNSWVRRIACYFLLVFYGNSRVFCTVSLGTATKGEASDSIVGVGCSLERSAIAPTKFPKFIVEFCAV